MYQALYRVYRPQTFDDMVGQQLISKTLKNAIKSQKISHAYLFSGPRGTGKTSAAKIFAKAINCPNQTDGNPCNDCDMCKAITQGALADVIEIDAASNNGVEEIRDIRDKSRYAPTQATYKVYIIDEVHMLSTGAFNALLKTLEEPTPNVVFVLATTEIHKVLDTILSRVQRFEFKRIANSDIEQRLIDVLTDQQLNFEQPAIELIARSAKGGMRDALSLLDQVMSYADNTITYEDALYVTGSVGNDLLKNYVEAIYTKNIENALSVLNTVFSFGKDSGRFIEELLIYCKNLLVAKVTPNELQDMAFAKDIPDNTLYHMIDTLAQTQIQLKQTLQHELYLEVTTIKLASASNSNMTTDSKLLQQQIDDLKQQVEQLKSQSVVGVNQSVTVPKTVMTHVKGEKEYHVNVEKIYDILSKATKQHKETVMTDWEDILSCLEVSRRAKLNASTVLAASDTGVVIGFEYPMLCELTANDTQLKTELSSHAMRIINHPCHIECVPMQQWKDIRQNYINGVNNGTLSQYKTANDNDADQELHHSEHDNDDTNQIMSEVVSTAKAIFGDIVEVKE